MAAQALAIVGNYFFPGIGGVVGMLVGSLLFPEKLPDAVGPKLSDLKITVSTYGNMVPLVYKKARIGGNVIWSTPKIETENRQEAGKGGPEQTQITYSYSQSLAVSLCEGVIKDIARIWINNVLIYNVGASATNESILASQKIPLRIYKGTSDQMPDPLIQALEGIDKTSAYRGTAYVVFDNLQLADHGNHIQNIEFEVIKEGTEAPQFVQVSKVYESSGANTYIMPKVLADSPKVYKNSVNALKYGFLTADEFIEMENFTIDKFYYNDAYYNADTYPIYSNTDDGSVFGKGDYNYNLFPRLSMHKSFIMWNDGTKKYINNLLDEPVTSILEDTEILAGWINTQISKGVKVNNRAIAIFQPVSLTIENKISLMNLENDTFLIVDEPVGYDVKDIALTDNHYYIAYRDTAVSTNWRIDKYDYDFVFVSTIYSGATGSGGSVNTLITNSDEDIYLCDRYLSGYVIYKLIDGIAVEQFDYSGYDLSSTMVDVKNNTVFSFGRDTPYFEYHAMISPVTASTVYLKDVIKDLFVKSGESLDLLNVEGVTKTINGYVVARRNSLRSILEPLQQAYFIDGVESDGKLKYVERGGATVIEIPMSDVAAHSYGADAGENLEIERRQDVDLPAEITISYQDLDGDYQTGTQYSRRQNTSAVNAISIELPMSFTGSEAKQITDVLLQDSWQSRNTVTFSLPKKYAYLEPTDVISVWKNNDLYSLRITDIEQQNDIYKITAVTEDITKYQQEAVGASIPSRDQTIDYITPTNLEFLDIPLLRDMDDKRGCYVASSGYVGTGWKGAALMESKDAGKTYTQWRTLTRDAKIGYATTILGNWLGGYIFDESNSVTVKTSSLLSSLDELSVLNGGNLCLIGNEILQFKNAVLTAENTYKLTGFLRGKKGTEQYINTHTSSDRFILLDINTIDLLDFSSADFDIESYYKAVSYGDTLSNSLTKKFTYLGVAQECYAPVELSAGRAQDGNIQLNWTRRSRITNEWNNKIEVPLGEDAENYEIDIYNGSTVVRTLISTTSTVNYSSAQQVTDFGSDQNSVKFAVYQLSTLRGRGFGTTVTVTL